VTLVPRKREPELRRAFPGAVIPDILDLEEIPMLEENLIRERQQLVRKARKEGLQKGLEEGRKEGEVEGARQLLLRLLERRFGPSPSAHSQQSS
jgi:flagellar biosynthesis/type III secretory pathway protein FliH